MGDLRSGEENRLIVFDVEGILIPKIRFLLFDVFGGIGLRPFVKGAFYGLLYLVGLTSLKGSLKRTFKLLEGFPYERFISLFQGIPLMPGAEDVFRELREGGFKTALISSGIPRVALQRLAERLGADYISGPEIGVSEGRLTGEVWGGVIEAEGKATALKKLLHEENLASYHRVAVADDRNNLSLFQLCDLKIGYNPDFILSFKSDYVVKGGLSGIIPIIKGESFTSGESLSRNIVLREVIHVCGFSVPLVCSYLVDRHLIALMIFLVAMLYVTSETMRMLGIRLPIISDMTLMAAGDSELQEFVASPLFYASGIIISLVLVPESISYASITVLTLGDGFASLFGRKLGRRNLPFHKNKTVEGSLGGFLLALAGSLLFIEPYGALIASAAGMFAEVLPLPINDNITIPLTSGLALMAAASA
jgi:dolichol kinase/phosphoserine phosphatase